MMTRHGLVISTAVGSAGPSIARGWLAPAASETFEVMHTEPEWRQLLTPDQCAVLRRTATERPSASALPHEKRHGKFGAGEVRQRDRLAKLLGANRGSCWNVRIRASVRYAPP
jgi:hypothetical protein